MKRLLSTVCFSALATSAFAADIAVALEEPVVREISGYGQVYGGGLWGSSDGESSDGWAAGGSGQVNIPFADAWNAQLGLNIDAAGANGGRLIGYGGQAHLFWRDPSSYAVGGFAEISKYDVDTSGVDLWNWRIGPEAQVYFDRATLYGQAWYGQVNLKFDGDRNSADHWGLRGVARYFATDNLRFDGELFFSRISAEGEHSDTLGAALQAMYRFDNSPLSVFGRYQFENTSYSISNVDDLNTHKLLAGVRFSFGSSTLIGEDRNGASFDTFRPNLIAPAF